MTSPATASADILLVEDNPQDLELALRGLRHRSPDVRIAVARDGVEAIDYLLGDTSDATPSHPTPAVVLLDVKLPRVDGLEVLQRLRRHERTRTLPVVMLTSSREQADVERSYDYGANSYVVKPLDFEEFMSTMGSLDRYWIGFNRRPTN